MRVPRMKVRWAVPIVTATMLLALVTPAQAATLAISTTALPQGQVGVVYSQTATATGGTGPYTWSVTSGALPAGLTLNTSTGAIAGTPTTAGTSTFTLQVADSASATDTQSLSITVSATGTLAVTTTAFPVAVVGSGFSGTLLATGGTAPYVWSIISGGLAGGLTLDTATGVISGTPTAAGTSTFTAQVTDAASLTATASLSITTQASLVVSTTSLADGQVGVAYSQTLAATGGVTPYTWSVTSGSLPAGLTLNSSTGVISGTPTAAGTSTFTVQVTDDADYTATASLSITVGGTLAVSTTSLSGGTVGVAYSQTLASTGGVSPVTWSIISDALPSGLALNSSTGVVSGTPTAAGTSTFTVQVTDDADRTATASLTITVVAADDGGPREGVRGMRGLCNAIERGSEHARAHKRLAPPFAALLRAAGAGGLTLSEFCAR